MTGLEQGLELQVDSSKPLLTQVQTALRGRKPKPVNSQLADRLGNVPEFYDRARPDRLETIKVRPIDLLHHLGLITANPGLGGRMLGSTGLWAVLRYAFAFEATSSGHIGLSELARTGLRYHQRMWFSEYLGIATSSLLMGRQLFSPAKRTFGHALDADYLATDKNWGSRLGVAKDFNPSSGSWPDYYFFDQDPLTGTAPTAIVECKGHRGADPGYIYSQFADAAAQLDAPANLAGTVPRRLMIGAAPVDNQIRAYALELQAKTSANDESGKDILRPSSWLGVAKALAFAGADSVAWALASDQAVPRDGQPRSQSTLSVVESELGDFAGTKLEIPAGAGLQLTVFAGINRRLLEASEAGDLERARSAQETVAGDWAALAGEPKSEDGDRARSFLANGTILEMSLVRGDGG